MSRGSASVRRHAVLAAMAAALVLACGPSKDEQRVAEAWLTCDECVEGEREAVIARGNALSGLFAHAVRNGPTTARRQNLRRQFVESAPAGPGILSPDAYADSLLANYVAGYQERAAHALAEIAPGRARGVFDDVLADSTAYRADVLATVAHLRALIGARAFGGQVTPRAVRYGDTLHLEAPFGSPFTGDEFAIVAGAPFDSSALRLSVTPQRLSFAAATREGPQTVRVTNVGTTTRSETASFVVTSLSDRNDRRMLACEEFSCAWNRAEPIPASALPFEIFLSLSRRGPRPDTVDLFKFDVTAPLTVTATLSWPPGTAGLGLSWRTCTFPFPGSPTMAPTTAPTEMSAGIVIPSGACRGLWVTLAPGGSRRAFARLRVTSP